MLNAPLDIGMNILQDSEKTSITIPTNTSDRLLPNSTETQHEETNTQTEVQPYDWKDKNLQENNGSNNTQNFFQDMLI